MVEGEGRTWVILKRVEEGSYMYIYIFLGTQSIEFMRISRLRTTVMETVSSKNLPLGLKLI